VSADAHTAQIDPDVIPPDIQGCTAWVESPHYSSGAGGVIVKTRYRCDSGYSMTITEALSYLYYCGGSKPSGTSESTWTGSYGCGPVKSSHYTTDFYVGSGAAVTKYTPPLGQSGAKYKGYYIACTRYNRTGVSTTIRITSAAAYVTW
jgi:hypothetical protein